MEDTRKDRVTESGLSLDPPQNAIKKGNVN